MKINAFHLKPTHSFNITLKKWEENELLFVLAQTTI